MANLNLNSEAVIKSGDGFIQKLKNFRELNLILIILTVCIIMSFWSQYFLTWGNAEAVLMSFTTDGIVVIGMTILLIVGGIDISVGAVLGLAMCVTGKLFLLGLNPWLAALIALIMSCMIGALIGFLVIKVKLSFFICTLALSAIARGMCLVITQGTPLSLISLPPQFKFMGQGKIFGVPFIIILFFIIAIICDFMCRKSSLLRKVFYTGSNEKAAMYSGINVNKVKLWVSVLCSGLTGLAGIIYVARFSSATPTSGQGLEMTAISAAVIGGASLNGGKGTVFGAVLGITLLQVVSSSLILKDVNPYWQTLVSGLILILAISLDAFTQKDKA